MGRCHGENQREAGHSRPKVRAPNDFLQFFHIFDVDGEFGSCVSVRYSEQYRFRPAASPIITETLPDGRTKVRGGRHGDDIPIPKPTGTAAVQAKKKERRRRSKKKH
jgi:hypothetical protein